MSDNFSDHFSTSLYTPINVWQNKKSNQHTHTHTQKNKKPAPIFFCAKKSCANLCSRERKRPPAAPPWGWMQHQLGSTLYKSLGFHPSSTSHSFTRPGPAGFGAIFFWGGKKRGGNWKRVGKEASLALALFFFPILVFWDMYFVLSHLCWIETCLFEFDLLACAWIIACFFFRVSGSR